MPGEEAQGCGIGRVASQAPSDFLSQACSLPSYQALITDLDPMQLQPPTPRPTKAPAEGSHTSPPLAQALSALLKPCLCPELGNCEPHTHGVHRTSASAVLPLGCLLLEPGHLLYEPCALPGTHSRSPRANAFCPHASSQALVCSSLALLRDPRQGLTTRSLGLHHFNGLPWLVLTSLG